MRGPDGRLQTVPGYSGPEDLTFDLTLKMTKYFPTDFGRAFERRLPHVAT